MYVPEWPGVSQGASCAKETHFFQSKGKAFEQINNTIDLVKKQQRGKDQKFPKKNKEKKMEYGSNNRGKEKVKVMTTLKVGWRR